MACPKCGCKETYYYEIGDDAMPGPDDIERCAACGYIFYTEEAEPEEEDDYL